MRVVIVGAGFGGIGAAIELRRHGFDDITILEQHAGLGGTWLANTYPGAACDVASQLYSYSFAQRRDWSAPYSPQPEILAYIRDVARRHGVDRLVRTGAEVTACAWSDETRSWTVALADGEELAADAVILATGQLQRPSFPRVEGVDTFEGHAFHSARWDHDYDLRGKRVAVVGTGATAVQIIPEIAPVVDRLVLFQRTGNWFLPKTLDPYGRLRRAVIARVPGLQAFRRRQVFYVGEILTTAIRRPRTVGRLLGAASAAFMRRQLRGHDELRERIWPNYTFGCKRVLLTSDYLPALIRPNVEVVTDAIAGFAPEGVVTAEGQLHEVDCVIYATGFRTTDFMFPMDVHGAGGRSLADVWERGAHAHLGITVPGFPSLFVMYGPNTNTSGGSIITYLEAQAGYIRSALEQVRARGAAAVDVRPEVEAASDRDVQSAFEGTAWLDCDSWYRDEDGRIVTNWPLLMRDYIARTEAMDPAEYEFLEPAS